MRFLHDFLASHAPLRRTFDYSAAPKEKLACCPGCGGPLDSSVVPFAAFDRYGFATQTSWCRRCDMLFVNPRLTAEAYAAFYDEGSYRALIYAFCGGGDGHTTPQKRVLRQAALLKEQLGDRPVSVLNVGGTRADYDALRAQLSLKDYLCLNPGGEEAGDAYAVEKTVLEAYDGGGRTFDLVCLFGTLNHLLWPLRSFRIVASLLAPDGLFAFDFKDPLVKMSRMSHPAGALQFDHPVYPTQRTLRHLLDESGLRCAARQTDDGRVFSFFARHAQDGRAQDALEAIPSPSDEIEIQRRRASRVSPGILLRAVLSAIRKGG